MLSRVNKIRYKGTVENRSDSKQLIFKSGDFVFVKRNILRLIILRCPCGCGDDLLINLDKRAGPAWRLYAKSRQYSLYPSYWRDTNCGSHFIIWKNRVFWFHEDHNYDEDWQVHISIEQAVLSALSVIEYIHYLELADKCSLIPWECLKACLQLCQKGLCRSNEGLPKERFIKN